MKPPKATVVLHDTADDRREVWSALLRGLTVDQRVAYHQWVCDLANLTCPGMIRGAGAVSVNLAALGETLRLSRNGDILANVAHVNEIYLDVAQLAHNWGLDYLSCLVELENRARGREPTPARYAAAALLALRSVPHVHDGQAARRGEGRPHQADPPPGAHRAGE